MLLGRRNQIYSMSSKSKKRMRLLGVICFVQMLPNSAHKKALPQKELGKVFGEHQYPRPLNPTCGSLILLRTVGNILLSPFNYVWAQSLNEEMLSSAWHLPSPRMQWHQK